MPIFAPEIVGPASPCSKQIRVRGHLAGATVSILVKGSETYSRESSNPDEYFDVGTELGAGDKITAIQSFGGEKSPKSPLPVTVQELPGELAHLTVATQVYQCGSAVFVTGAVPGARVEVSVDGTEAGETQIVEGVGHIYYSPGAQEGKRLSFKQSTCNGLSKSSSSQKADPLPNKLPKPKVEGLIFECQTAITIGGVYGGATVTMYREGEDPVSLAFDLETMTWFGHKPFKKGELLQLEQAFFCKPGSPATLVSDRKRKKVRGLDELGAPTILGPVCPKPTLVTVTNLVPSARVVLYQDDKAIGMTDAPDKTFSFPVDKLKAGSKLTARMQLCGKDGPLSNAVTVTEGREIEYINPSTMYECASHILIREDSNLQDGKIVYATSAKLGQISAYHQVFVPRFLLPVSPSLVKDDEITVHIIQCGGEEKRFGPYEVENAGRMLAPPRINEPVAEDAVMVEVISSVAGAIIEVSVDGVAKAQAISRGDQSYTPVMLPEKLKLKQQVTATQTLCSISSKPSEEAVVTNPPPFKPILMQPVDDRHDLSASEIEFRWKDPGTGGLIHADSFQLKLYKNGALLHTYVTQSDSHTVHGGLERDTNYRWKVKASNAAGSATSVTRDFKTRSGGGGGGDGGDGQQHPGEAAMLFTSAISATQDQVNLLWPVPPLEDFYLTVGVGNAEDATSGSSQILFSIVQGENSFGALVVDVPALASGENYVAFAPVEQMSEGQYTVEASLIVDGEAVDYRSWGMWVGL